MNSPFTILNPCHKRWTELDGKENTRVRHCAECNTPVHAFEQYSAEEWQNIWYSENGRLCVLICGESPEPVRSRRAILFGALVTFISPLMAQSGLLRIRVVDVTGVGIPEADVILNSSDDKALRETKTDGFGDAFLGGLPFGDHRLHVRRAGFQSSTVHVIIASSEEMKINVALQVGMMGGPVQVTVDITQISANRTDLSVADPNHTIRLPQRFTQFP